jgi:taurine dioxygenase
MKSTDDVAVVLATGGGLGAEIRGLDLRRLCDHAFGAVHRAWRDHLALLFRRQQLTDAELIAFSRRFGELDLAPIQETGRRFVEGLPELYVVSNVLKDGEPIGSLGYGEAVWHTDMSYLPDPPMASVLYALEVPATGGNTEFVNMYLVYEALPAGLKRRIAGLRVKHDGTYNSGGYVRQGITPSDDPRESPGVFHPLVCTHPETGRRMLYRTPSQCLYRRFRFGGIGGASRCAMVLYRPRGIRLAYGVASWRSHNLGQPLHHASS